MEKPDEMATILEFPKRSSEAIKEFKDAIAEFQKYMPKPKPEPKSPVMHNDPYTNRERKKARAKNKRARKQRRANR